MRLLHDVETTSSTPLTYDSQGTCVEHHGVQAEHQLPKAGDRDAEIWRRLRETPDRGQISVLLIGMVSVALLLVLGVVGATSVQLSRIHLLDAADAAALAAADAVDEEAVYGRGLGDGVPLTAEGVVAAAAEHLARQPVPPRVGGWQLAPGTGTPDSRTAVVRVQGEARIPLVSGILRPLGGGVVITVESRARSDLE
jgi:hypothetical protein